MQPPATSINKSASQLNVKFIWWNAYDFYHYDASRSKTDRWPATPQCYAEKILRAEQALKALFGAFGTPSLLALGEITNKAAKELRDRLLPTYEVISLDTHKAIPSLQVAALIAPSTSLLSFSEVAPITVENVPRGTRPMAAIDMDIPDHKVRFVICHWNAKFGENAEKTRERIADALSIYAYRFLNEKSTKKHHLVIIGDLNDEPYGVPLETLNAHMHRARALAPTHWADKDVKRVHLYNCSWRLFGEINPHAPGSASKFSNAAGTYYWESKKSWAVLDQLIVSGSLLGTTRPYLDESGFHIAALPQFFHNENPIAFRKRKAGYEGLSDHLPICAEILI